MSDLAREAEVAHRPSQPPVGGNGQGLDLAKPVDQNQKANRNVVLRASDEFEFGVKPGEQRPFVVIDEMSRHYEDVPEEKYTAKILLNKVREKIEALKVPVESDLVEVKWHTDTTESRERVVCWLKNHSFSDFKIIFGVDYMGRWADVRMLAAMEPEPIPKRPEKPKMDGPDIPPPNLAFGVLAVAVLSLILGVAMSKGMLGLLGFIGLVAGIVLLIRHSNKKNRLLHEAQKENDVEYQRLQREYEEKMKARENENFAKIMLRNFKFDDMKLFSSAMRLVFLKLVEDIEREGATLRKSQDSGDMLGGSRAADAASAGI